MKTRKKAHKKKGRKLKVLCSGCLSLVLSVYTVPKTLLRHQGAVIADQYNISKNLATIIPEREPEGPNNSAIAFTVTRRKLSTYQRQTHRMGVTVGPTSSACRC